MELQYASPEARPTSPGAARLRLRAATADDHAAVDRAYSVFDLSRPSDYRAFLQAQAACLAPLEAALTAAGAERVLADWRERLRADLIAADLADMGAAQTVPHPPMALEFRRPAAVLGALYVLEGSRFGGQVLARRLPAEAPARFLRAAAEPQSWRTLLSALDRRLGSEPAMAAAVSAARAVFAAFETAARLRLEPALG